MYQYTLHNGTTKPSVLSQESSSLLEDETFQVFDQALKNDEERKIWHNLVAHQGYLDPIILLRAESFTNDIVNSEPGKQIDYAKIREDLAKAKADLSGSYEDKQKLIKLHNKLVDGHTHFVQATARALGYDLYNKLIDRFYGKVEDNTFNQFIATKLPPNIVRNWPSYINIKQSTTNNIRTWRHKEASASYRIEQLKSSVEVKVLLAKLKTAVERHEDRQRKLTGKPNTTDHRYRPRSPAQTARLARAHRRASIEKRNRLIEENRSIKNHRLKSTNLRNIHQLGDQTRVCLPDYVIRALTDSQDKYSAALENEKEKGDMEEDGLHEFVQQMHIVKDGGVYLLGGIVIPEGHVHLGSTADHHGANVGGY